MRERAERLRGQLLLTSSPGKGTQVRLSVPNVEHHFSHD
jgi:signal transduction histidine kinase